MKAVLKKMLYAIVKKLNIAGIVNDIQNRQSIAHINTLITNNGATFYEGAAVINFQNNTTKITVNQGTHIRGELHIFKYGGEITIGEHCYVGDHSRIWSGDQITIGNFVQISHNVNIIDTSAHEFDAYERAERYVDLMKSGPWTDKGNVTTAPIVIEDYAWISFNASILKGVKIGKGAIVGACSVVTKDVEPFTLVAGNPAKFIRKLDSQQQ